MNEELRRDIDRFVEENTENIKRDIARLVAIHSVEGEPEADAPFGRGPREALDLGLTLRGDWNLACKNSQDIKILRDLGFSAATASSAFVRSAASASSN